MRIHFIGIGGIGVSALAGYYLTRGHQVSGSNLEKSEITRALTRKGVKIFIGHKGENLPLATKLVIYSSAVSKDNLEILAAKKLGIKTLTYGEALGELTKKYFTIAVSGMHGKSTTTAMLALLLEKAGLDPTVIIGTKLREWRGANFRVGKSKYLIIEADEYRAAFLNYWPKMIVLTNIEAEHLDYYRDLNHILQVFKKYVSHLKRDGILVANEDDKNILKLIGQTVRLPFTVQKYSLKQTEAENLKGLLKVPGRHNVSNALAVLAVGRLLNISDEIIFQALGKFRGAWRRFAYREKYNGAMIFDDYGHHPTEIKATLAGARELMVQKKMIGNLWCVFQPHHYARLEALFPDFVQAFDEADKIVLLDIYNVAGREDVRDKAADDDLKQKLVTELVKKGKGVQSIATVPLAADYLRENIKEGDLVILMGAGDIYRLKMKK